MKRWTFFLLLLTIICSCEKDEEIRPEERLVGYWELQFSVIGSERKLSPVGGVSFDFKSDHTYIKKLGLFDWRDEGIWAYNQDTRTLNLNYKTYTNEISDSRSVDLEVEELTEKELVFKVDYNDTNSLGEFVEFEFVHYLGK